MVLVFTQDYQHLIYCREEEHECGGIPLFFFSPLAKVRGAVRDRRVLLGIGAGAA